MSISFENAVERVCSVVMFENWLRFYFIEEDGDGRLFIIVPDKGLEKLHKDYPHLAGLADRLNKQEIDHKRSVESVCLYVASEIDGVSVPEAMISRVFDSREFQLRMNLFGTWVQSHEEQLDEGFMEFTVWQELFTQWQKTDKVQEYLREVEARMNHTVEAPSDTVH